MVVLSLVKEFFQKEVKQVRIRLVRAQHNYFGLTCELQCSSIMEVILIHFACTIKELPFIRRKEVDL